MNDHTPAPSMPLPRRATAATATGAPLFFRALTQSLDGPTAGELELVALSVLPGAEVQILDCQEGGPGTFGVVATIAGAPLAAEQREQLLAALLADIGPTFEACGQ